MSSHAHRWMAALALVLALGLAACGGATATDTPVAAPAATPTTAGAAAPAATGKTRVAFVYVGPHNDGGWSQAHDDGRLALEKALPDQVETTYVESVPDTDDQKSGAAIRQLADKGYDVIVTTSFGFMKPTADIATQYPKIQFVHISGYMTNTTNMSTAFGQIEEARYVAGIVAGRMTKVNVLGYVAAYPIPEVIRGINAFTLGVLSVNPQAKVKVVWTNTWYDPQKESAAAQSLVDAGADVLAQHQDSTASVQVAQKAFTALNPHYSVGYDSDMSAAAPDADLTSPIWHWGVFYTQMVNQIRAGTWKPGQQYWGSWQDGLVDLAPLHHVPDAVMTEAQAAEARFKSGQADDHTIFTGPLSDNTGKAQVPAGRQMSTGDILNMSWFVQGVDGTIPKQ